MSPPTSCVPAGHAGPVAVAPVAALTGTGVPANLGIAALFADAGPKKPMTSMITSVDSEPKFLMLMLSAQFGQPVIVTPFAIAPFMPGNQLITLVAGAGPVNGPAFQPT